MKRLLVLITVCLALLAGCNRNTTSAGLPTQSNNGGAQAGDAPGGSVADENKNPASSDVGDAGVDIEIKEKMFITQVNDIYLNSDDYLGKTIKYEGVFDSNTWEEESQTYYSVIRYGPGCCGDDGNVGFEVVWDGDYPEKNDWVEAVGILEKYENNGLPFLRVALTSLTVLETRGTENVSQ